MRTYLILLALLIVGVALKLVAHRMSEEPVPVDCPTAPCTSVRGTTNTAPWSVKRGSAEPEVSP